MAIACVWKKRQRRGIELPLTNRAACEAVVCTSVTYGNLARAFPCWRP